MMPTGGQQQGRGRQVALPNAMAYREILFRPVPVTRNPVGEAGWGGNFESGVNIFTNFLQGFIEGRRQQWAETEADREQKLNILQQRLMQVQQSDLAPQAKEDITNEIYNRMMQVVVGEQEGKKSRGSKGFGRFADIFGNIFGAPSVRPQAPDVSAWDQSIGQSIQTAPKVQQVMLEANSDFAKAVEESTLRDASGNVIGVSRARLAAHPLFRSASQKLASAGIYQVPKAWEEQIGVFLDPKQELEIQRRMRADEFEKKAVDALVQWEQSRMSGQSPVTPDSEEAILGPVVPLPADALIERKPVKIFLDHPSRQSNPIAAWDFGNGIRVQVGTNRLIAPNAEQLGWINRGASAPKPVERDSQDVLNATLRQMEEYAQSAGAPTDIVKRARNAYNAAVESTGLAKDAAQAFRSVVDAWINREDRRLAREMASSEREDRAKERRMQWEVEKERQIQDDLQKVWQQYQEAKRADELVRRIERTGRWTPSDEQALIYQFNKILDPRSVVRESEYERVKDAAPLIDRIKTELNRLARGDTIPDRLRADIVRTIKLMSGFYEDVYAERARTAYNMIQGARQRGFDLDPERAIPGFEQLRDKIEMRQQNQPATMPPPQGMIPPSPFRRQGGGQQVPGRIPPSPFRRQQAVPQGLKPI